MIRQATEKDLLCISNIYIKAFPESIMHIFAKKPTAKAVQLAFRVLLKAEAQAFFVAEAEGQIIGYIFAPSNISNLWLATLKELVSFKWLFLLLSGDLKIGFNTLKILLSNKLSFIFSAKEQFPIKARILSLAVLPDFQGCGIGRKLVEKSLLYLDSMNVSAIRLEVRPENIAALKLYQQFTFHVVGSTSDSQGTWLIMVRR